MRRFILSALFVLVCHLITVAQQDPQFGQYMFNPGIWNPSYAAVKNKTIVNFHHRTQWLGYSVTDNNPSINPPSTQQLTLTTSIKKINSGIGLNLLNDNIGPLKNQNFILSYSYAFSVGEGKISAGAGLGGQLISVNTDLWRPEDKNDPTLISAGSINEFKPLLRAGLSYSNENLFVGLSVNNITTPSYSYNRTLTSKLERHYYLQAQYKIALSDNLSLQPGFLFKRTLSFNSFELSNLFLIRNFWLGISYRTEDAVIFLAGLDLLKDKSLKFGYNFDLSVINPKAKSVTSHEIFLSYNFGSLLDNKKPVIRSPRFRF